MKIFLPTLLLSPVLLLSALAQEGTQTQVLITVDSKDPNVQVLKPADLTIDTKGFKQPPTTLSPVLPAGTQIALLIDDGLRESVGRELSTLKTFVANLSPGTEIFIGYMSQGRIQQVSGFTTNHAAAAATLRLPLGAPGISASPYFCVSDFVKRWPVEVLDNGAPTHVRARFVLMITNGVDPYNGSTSPMNQDSPYVTATVADAQRAGVPVYSIYYADAGVRGNRASFSGQSYLAQLAEGTGARAYYEGSGNPVSMEPFLKSFQRDVSETYIATFPATGKDLAELKVKSNVPHLKLRAPQAVKVGNLEASAN